MPEQDAAAVRDTISWYGRFIDDRDWAGLSSIVADTIQFDFTSLWGGEQTVGGRYRFGLRRAARRWVIDGLSLRVAWVDGNQAVITGPQ